MRHLLEPSLVSGPLGDPGLFVDLRDERRALLIDLGDIASLPPRKLMRVSHVFVSHTHMDHFAGFDALLRVVLGRKQSIVLTGGPGFVDQVEHKLRAYTWNVVHRYAVELVLDVREIGADFSVRRARFSSRTGFAREAAAPVVGAGDTLLDEPLLRVRGRFVDHGIPCLAFAIEEKPRPRVAKNRLAALGIGTGAWLRELKQAVVSGAVPDSPIQMIWRDRGGEHRLTRSVGQLSDAILDFFPGRRIGYVTDLRDTPANRRALAQLLTGVDQLFIEAVFLDADRDQALRKNHLTARQAGEIARELGARYLVPFHFSPRYGQPRAPELDAQAHAAWHHCNGGGQERRGSVVDSAALRRIRRASTA
jgi:ribonuclease Z